MSLPSSRSLGIVANSVQVAPIQRKKETGLGRYKGQAGSIYRIGGNWIGRYRAVVDGRKKRLALYVGQATGKDKLTESEASRLLRLKLDEMGVNSTETLLVNKGLGETFEQKATWWQENKLIHLKPSSANMPYVIKKHLSPIFGHLPVSTIDEQKVQEWISALTKQGKLQAKTISNVYKLLKIILGKKHTLGWSIKLPSIPIVERRFFTIEERDKIVEGAETGQSKELFRLHFELGARFGELAGLHVEDIDFDLSIVHIRRSTYRNIETAPKTGAGYRNVNVKPEVLAKLREFLGDRKEGRIFATRKGTPLKVGDFNRDVLKPLLAKLNIPHGTSHAFRHGRISQLQMERVPGDLIVAMVGHTDLKTTSRYTHFTEEFKRDLVSKLK